MKKLLACAALILLVAEVPCPGNALRNFITTHGDQLMDGKKPFRFVSFNIPNLHYVEDDLALSHASPFRLPDQFEIEDALETIKQMGGQVVRCYTLPVIRTNDTPAIPRYVLGPGKFNEEAFRTLDHVLQVANQKGIRIILPFVDNWSWWGGVAEYAGFRGKPRGAFWTDGQVINDFKETIRFVVTRTNTLTGVPYFLDKAILCWETGNELQSPPEWTAQIAAYIKSLDSHHLVMDGFHTTELRKASLDIPEVDIVTTHHYPGGQKSYSELAMENQNRARGRKPYLIGEFGFVDTPVVAELLETVRHTGISGALIWSLRVRNRDGGFYWHSEPAGGNKYKSYHWPGFSSGAEYDERNLMTLLRREAHAIRGIPTPKYHAPAAPHLLPVFDPGAISWRGSVGATTYIVERSRSRSGPWTIADAEADETLVQYRPLFADTLVTEGSWYYRVRARNVAGKSSPSNVQGPVAAHMRTIVDEMDNVERWFQLQGNVTVQARDARKAREDAHRVAGGAGSAIVYLLPGPLIRCHLDAFYPDKISEFRFLLSANRVEFTPVPATSIAGPEGAGDYDYWKSARFEATPTPANAAARYLKIEFTGEAQVGRVELHCGLK